MPKEKTFQALVLIRLSLYSATFFTPHKNVINKKKNVVSLKMPSGAAAKHPTIRLQ